METIIDIKHLSKVYHLYDRPVDRLKEVFSLRRKSFHREHNALKDISLRVQKGDCVGIVGKNGSGKSTLLKIIAGVVSPTGGEVAIKGKISALLELGAGFNPEYTGLENIYLNGTMMGYSRTEMAKKVNDIIAFADIGDYIHQPVKTYSSGMFARLAFAVSISVEPDILIVDEVLSVGDARFQVKCIDKMKELKAMGTTILFVSHATEQIKRFCNKAVWMQDGEIRQIGEAGETVDIYENDMRFGDTAATKTAGKQESPVREKPSMAYINSIQINQGRFRTFDTLVAEVEYEICEEEIEGFILGVAIYTANRDHYIFGPNTYLDKTEVPGRKGIHKVRYVIPRLPLIRGQYVLDVGIFNSEGIVNFDYKTSAVGFSVSNPYFSEGDFYMEHTWEILQ